MRGTLDYLVLEKLCLTDRIPSKVSFISTSIQNILSSSIKTIGRFLIDQSFFSSEHAWLILPSLCFVINGFDRIDRWIGKMWYLLVFLYILISNLAVVDLAFIFCGLIVKKKEPVTYSGRSSQFLCSCFQA